MNDYNAEQQQNQESQQMEWKWSWHDEFLKWLCGYANTEGGTLYIGVNDDGYVVGIEDSKRMIEGLPSKIHDKLGIIASINIYKANGAENVRYGNRIPKSISEKLINQYACGKLNSAMIESTDKRSGSTLHELNGFELQNFLLERAGKTWDTVSVPEVGVSDLSKDALDAFRKKAVKSNRMTESEVNVSDELLRCGRSTYYTG